MKKTIFLSLITVLLFLHSCASTPGTHGAKKQANILPLSNGWYIYDSIRTFKGIEDEYNFAINYGMPMVQEITWKYTGVVAGFDNGALFDPVTGLELLITDEGQISCAGNLSIRGAVNSDGTFFWSGLYEEHGKLNSAFVRGTLTPLPSSARGGSEYDGIYHMTDTDTGREQLVRIKDGFYTWHYLDEYDDESGFSPWPTLIRRNGTFSFSVDITTVMEMGNLSSTNFTTGFMAEGRIIPGKGISLEEVSRTAGTGTDIRREPHTFSGKAISPGEFHNEDIPHGIEDLIMAGRYAARATPRPNRANYPAWYLSLPQKTGFIYATGKKSFEDRDTAFVMAKVAATANLADQMMMQIITNTVEITNNALTMTDDRIRTEAIDRINYRVAERAYNTRTRTAFVLLEMEI